MVGNFLSERAQRALLQAKIKPGCIIHLFCKPIHNPKNKFIVVAHIDYEEDFLLAFIVNSEINQFIEKNPELKKCQIPLMRIPNYDFFTHDSFLDCSQIVEGIDIEDVFSHLLTVPNDHKGHLHSDDIKQIIKVIAEANTIANEDKGLIIRSLTS